MSVPSLFPSAFQVPGSAGGSRLQYLVCLSLVSHEAKITTPFLKTDALPRFSGRYPWAIEDALHKYGDVLRIAPNELCFFTPQAFLGKYSIYTLQHSTDAPSDIYSPHEKNLEVFAKTNFQNRGKDLGGIVWEEDPVRHREVVKKLSPAFSSRSIKALEPVAHEYMDYFVTRMKELGSEPTGVGLMEWTNWLAMDQAADMAWNEKLHQMRDRRLFQKALVPIASHS